ncbi:odorant receptor coreceptor [Drosophila grimshawi]|uniref:Odorant receptor n=1 Tax=Drosophila grimshawi TaxID=7222 RepID=B4JSL9_DROGR|nr:odorant receptor coreceptor [Drosophila grimshawi]EDV94759.1 GH22610 [Drosophila grimshawi]
MSTSMQPSKYTGLVADLMPNILTMRYTGLFMHNFTGGSVFMKRIFSSVHLVIIVLQFCFILVNMALNAEEVNELSGNTITTLFFTHCIVKFVYLAINQKNFYRTLNIWNQANSHSLFAESDARYHSISLAKMRKLFFLVMLTTVASATAWITITFFGESVKFAMDKETNSTITVPIPRLPIKAFYPWDSSHGMFYMISFVLQIYYVLFSMMHSNLCDVMFCSWLIFACEQLQHLKGIMKPLMELSASLDTYRPNSAALFRSLSANSKSELIHNEEKEVDMDMTGIYSTKADWGAQFRAPSTLQSFNPAANGNGMASNPNGLSKKQEMMVRSAIKYWVERHKHVVRLVAAIGDTYGAALLLHMLVSTIMLTLLAYQATKINGVNVYAFTVIGYLGYALAQVFHFCIFGNRLIEESSSVMEAAYSCHWYDGSEEAKTFVQIVCQQCQKAMSISGAKFFTVSLDLFASVLGAVVTYFMVLVQLK